MNVLVSACGVLTVVAAAWLLWRRDFDLPSVVGAVAITSAVLGEIEAVAVRSR